MSKHYHYYHAILLYDTFITTLFLNHRSYEDALPILIDVYEDYVGITEQLLGYLQEEIWDLEDIL